MGKFITDEHTGLTIGIYGQRHRRYLRQNKRCLYQYLFLTVKLDALCVRLTMPPTRCSLSLPNR